MVLFVPPYFNSGANPLSSIFHCISKYFLENLSKLTNCIQLPAWKDQWPCTATDPRPWQLHTLTALHIVLIAEGPAFFCCCFIVLNKLFPIDDFKVLPAESLRSLHGSQHLASRSRDPHDEKPRQKPPRRPRDQQRASSRCCWLRGPRSAPGRQLDVGSWATESTRMRWHLPGKTGEVIAVKFEHFQRVVGVQALRQDLAMSKPFLRVKLPNSL